jgi:hypothetical protein
MLEDLNPTTRCFYRTMRDAWQQDNYDWWEGPPERDWKHHLYTWLGVALWAALAIIYWRYL